MKMEYDIVVIGGGILGLSVAKEIIDKNPEIKLLVLEKENTLASHQTGRNSGVIHSGIYYEPDSKKSEYCIKGGQKIKNYCKKNGIPLKKVGKMIMATGQKDMDVLYFLKKRAEYLGLNHSLLNSAKSKEVEPHAHCIESIFFPDVCITDYAAICQCVKKELEQKGVDVLFSSKVDSVQCDIANSYIQVRGKTYVSKNVINCTGVHADSFLRQSHRKDVRIIPFKGVYWKASAPKISTNLYPVPNLKLPFLGVHFTPTINNEVLIGPNAFLSFDKEGYGNCDFDIKDTYDIFSFSGFWNFFQKNFNACINELKNSSRKSTWKSARLMCPSLAFDAIRYHSSGIRAQAMTKDGKLCDDFVFFSQGNVLNVINAPSPAATSSFEIAKHIVGKIDL